MDAADAPPLRQRAQLQRHAHREHRGAALCLYAQPQKSQHGSGVTAGGKALDLHVFQQELHLRVAVQLAHVGAHILKAVKHIALFCTYPKQRLGQELPYPVQIPAQIALDEPLCYLFCLYTAHTHTSPVTSGGAEGPFFILL